MTTIIVTGRISGTGAAVNRDDIHYAHPSSGFFLSYTIGSVVVGTNVSEVGTTQTVAKTANKPRTVMENVSADQTKAVNDALSNAANSTDLAKTFDEMADANVTLRVKVIAAPADALAGEQARISFSANTNGAAPDTVAPNTDVTITIFGDRLNNNTLQDTFRFVLAHELTHLLRDASGSFLSDSGTVNTYSREQEIYDALYGSGASASPPATASFDSSMYRMSITGTSGNDYILADEMGDAYGAMKDSIITSGAGFDMIVSGQGIDRVIIDGPGKKVLYDYGGSYNSLTINSIYGLPEVLTTKVGMDLYITNAYSSSSVIDDPNAVILAGWFYSNGYDTIEFMVLPSGEFYSFNQYLDSNGNWFGPVYSGNPAAAPLAYEDVFVTGNDPSLGEGALMQSNEPMMLIDNYFVMA